jgi:hypothetical protein
MVKLARQGTPKVDAVWRIDGTAHGGTTDNGTVNIVRFSRRGGSDLLMGAERKAICQKICHKTRFCWQIVAIGFNALQRLWRNEALENLVFIGFCAVFSGNGVEPVVGFEPTTDGLQNRCSTTELNWRIATEILRAAQNWRQGKIPGALQSMAQIGGGSTGSTPALRFRVAARS